MNHGRTESPVVEGIDDQVEGVGEADGDNHKPGKPVEGSPGNNLLLCMNTKTTLQPLCIFKNSCQCCKNKII